jgi:hypothetical protein
MIKRPACNGKIGTFGADSTPELYGDNPATCTVTSATTASASPEPVRKGRTITVTASADGYYRYSFAGTATTSAVNATGDYIDVQ